jgi:hypothetical protein
MRKLCVTDGERVITRETLLSLAGGGSDAGVRVDGVHAGDGL